MTTPDSNPSDDQTLTPPGQALRIARVGIALALFGGIGVFGVYAVINLDKGLDEFSQPPIGEQAYDGTLPGDLEIDTTNPLHSMFQIGPGILIDHHPAHIPPFPGAAIHGLDPYREPISSDGTVLEHAHYRVDGKTPKDAFAYYNQQATALGMTLQTNVKPNPSPQDDIVARWSRGRKSFMVTITPLIAETPQARPPVKPIPPLGLVVQYSYPAPRR